MSDYDGVCTNDCDNGEPCNGWHYKCCDFGTSAIWFEKNDLTQQNNNKMKKEKWYVGQKVWDEALKPGVEGKIIRYLSKNAYPIDVFFEDGRSTTYTDDGRIYKSFNPTLKPYPHRIEIHKIEPEFEKGQIVLVRDNNNQYWVPAKFIQRDGNVFDAEYLNVSCIGVSWRQCIPFEGNEHLLLTTDTP